MLCLMDCMFFTSGNLFIVTVGIRDAIVLFATSMFFYSFCAWHFISCEEILPVETMEERHEYMRGSGAGR